MPSFPRIPMAVLQMMIILKLFSTSFTCSYFVHVLQHFFSVENSSQFIVTTPANFSTVFLISVLVS